MQVIGQILLLVLALVFWCWVLRWFLGIYHLSDKLDKVLEELKEIKRSIGERATEHPTGGDGGAGR